ncbi:MAG: hypothetical protein R2849_00120 [Thermomicrobiales bacterium]
MFDISPGVDILGGIDVDREVADGVLDIVGTKGQHAEIEIHLVQRPVLGILEVTVTMIARAPQPSPWTSAARAHRSAREPVDVVRVPHPPSRW